ncbi:hypothetical protein ACFL0V_01095 [Nanoarchaeota archaeon]
MKKGPKLSWNQTMVIILAVFLVAMFLKTLTGTPSIEGYSVAGEPVQNSFPTTGVLLLVIFGFFGLFLLIISRKLDFHQEER